MELLKKLYTIHSMSGREKKMRKFIKRWVVQNVPEAVIEYDNSGNVYITKGYSETYPVVVAHLDQVQNDHSRDFQALEVDDIIIGYSPKSRAQQGLGADDKNGIWVGLNCLMKYDAIKAAFFVSEEMGCVGSERANMAFFVDARFVLQCDRRGANDLITTAGWTDLCSKEFVKAIQPELYGYKEANGMLTDVLTLKENGLSVCCLNISCGYYEPHTDYEFTCIPDLLNCLAFVEHIIETCQGVYPHTYSYTPQYPSKYDKKHYKESYDVYDWYGSIPSKLQDDEEHCERTFREIYYDCAKEFIECFPDASSDELYWYLKDSNTGVTFWSDWVKSLYWSIKYELLGCEKPI